MELVFTVIPSKNMFNSIVLSFPFPRGWREYCPARSFITRDDSRVCSVLLAWGQKLAATISDLLTVRFSHARYPKDKRTPSIVMGHAAVALCGAKLL